MKLFIPTIGSKLELIKDCEVTIHSEYRNYKFCEALGFKANEYYHNKDYENFEQVNTTSFKVEQTSSKTLKITLPKSLVLTVNRIYIRQGAEDFDSVTFNIGKNDFLPSGRFWLKLADVNCMDVKPFESVVDTQQDRKQKAAENQKKKNEALLRRVEKVEQQLKDNGKTFADIFKKISEDKYQICLKYWTVNKQRVERAKPKLNDYLKTAKEDTDYFLQKVEILKKNAGSYERRYVEQVLRDVVNVIQK